MKLEDYESLPDSMPAAEVHEHCMRVLSLAEAPSSVLAKLEVLADRQWHTYELPAPALQEALRGWLIRNWVSPDQDYLESVLGLAYCFGLDKELFQRALDNYTGEHAADYRQDLEMSHGENIDPWWSMKGHHRRGNIET
jgi:hypothetical protein